MVGAADDVFARVKPMLEAMGTTIHHCGGVGTGMRTKLVNNYLAIISCQLNAEAIALSQRFGLSLEKTLDVLHGTTATNGQLKIAWPSKVLKGDTEPGFTIDLAHKDLTLIVEAANAVNVPCRSRAVAREAFSAARSRGDGAQDFSAIVDVLCDGAGIATAEANSRRTMTTTYPESHRRPPRRFHASARPTSIRPTPPTSSASSRARHAASDVDAAIAAAREAFAKWSRIDAAGAIRHPRQGGHRDPRAQGRARPAARRASRASRSPTASARRHAPARSSSSSPAKPCASRARSSTRCGPASTSKSRASRSASSRRSRRGIFRSRFRRGRSRRRWRSATRVVFKPAELVPASPWTIADIVQRAGLPPGVLNLVHGAGLEARRGAGVVAGRRRGELHRLAGRRTVGRGGGGRRPASRVQLEMGGKNPLIVLDDADLTTAVSIAVNGAFFQAGQRCTASSRLIVTEGIHDRFVAAMIERMKTLVIDDALKPGIEIGPVVDDEQLEQEPRVRRDRQAGRRAARARRRAAEARHRRLLHGAGALHRDDAGDAHQSRGDLRTGRGGDSREGLRRGARGGERHAVRPVGGHRRRRRSSTRVTSSGTRRAGS